MPSRQEVLILIIMSIVRGALRPSSEGFTYVSDVTHFTIKFGNLYLIIDSTFLPILALVGNGAGKPS